MTEHPDDCENVATGFLRDVREVGLGDMMQGEELAAALDALIEHYGPSSVTFDSYRPPQEVT